jgi:putative DNA-invertase from lambdoid prophage Rac
VIVDHGVSGISMKLKERDQGKRLFDLLQAGDTLLVRWVGRLGRDYEDVKKVIEDFNTKGITVRTVINGMTFEADHNLSDPTMKAARAAILAFMAALAEATSKKEARQAGIAHALASPDADWKYRGKKPSYTRETFDLVQTMLAQGGRTVSGIAREARVARQTVLRIRDKSDACEATLQRWGM